MENVIQRFSGETKQTILLLILKMAYSLFKVRFIVSSLCCPLKGEHIELSEDEITTKYLFLERKELILEIRVFKPKFFISRSPTISNQPKQSTVLEVVIMLSRF